MRHNCGYGPGIDGHSARAADGDFLSPRKFLAAVEVRAAIKHPYFPSEISGELRNRDGIVAGSIHQQTYRGLERFDPDFIGTENVLDGSRPALRPDISNDVERGGVAGREALEAHMDDTV